MAISRRDIRAKVMQAVYACYSSEQEPEKVYELILLETEQELAELERAKGMTGDIKLMNVLYYESIKNAEKYDEYIKGKATNWNIERIARVDRILMHLAICEAISFEEIPIKVTINEYLELAKLYSTPDSRRFINGILDKLFIDLTRAGYIVKKGRGLNSDSDKNANSKA
ncbi:MAG: transcription antitermination factor NusB [Bacteroidia bacterium]